MVTFFKILGIVFLGVSNPLLAIPRALGLWGMWRLFVKCGERGWYALIPGWNWWTLARCADRETEGLPSAVFKVFLRVLSVSSLLGLGIAKFDFAFDVVLLLFMVLDLVWEARILLGLCDVFKTRKWWVLLWIYDDLLFIPALIWGLSDKFTPYRTTEEMDRDAEMFFSGAQATVLEQGLTVNLEDRTVRDFFKKRALLRDIHFSVEPGRMVLLLGGSGSGKTTLVNAINGYEKANAKVLLNGEDLYAGYKKLQYDIGFVPQQDLMRETDTVHATLMDAAALRLPEKFSRAERRKRVDEVMEMFGLQPVANSFVGKLSGGQRKRLSIAMEFIPNPTLFILDEPDSGLDAVMARSVMEKLHAISRQGKIVIVITHTPDRVADLFDDVIVLAKDSTRTGRLAWFGPIDDARRFFERETMEQVIKCINRKEEGGEGRADEFVKKFAEVQQNG